MALNIKNPEVEALAAEVAAMTGESKTEAVRQALAERKARLAFQTVCRGRRERVRRLLEREIWPKLPEALCGRRPTREEEDAILGYGPEGT